MGQPIYLERDGEHVTLYGRSEAQKYMAQGWKQIVGEGKVGPITGTDDLTRIKGVSDNLAGILANAGFKTYASIAHAHPDKLVALDGIGSKTAAKIQEEAEALL